MAVGVSFAVVFVVSVFLRDVAAQTEHVVGDAAAWTVPRTGAGFYSNWAATKKFSVGDSLVFNFMTDAHDVLEVNKESFDACNSNNGIGSIITVGPAKVTLNSAGVHYYICTIGNGGHCQGGQKLSITVSPNSRSPSSAATPSASPKGSPDAACTPDVSPSGGGGPQVVSPPGSSSHVVVATLFTTLFGLVLSLF